MTPLISQLLSLSLPHKYVINYPLIIDLIFTHFQNLGLQKGRNTFNSEDYMQVVGPFSTISIKVCLYEYALGYQYKIL